MVAHRVEIVMKEDGRLVLPDLPFRAGQRVEVIVLEGQGLAGNEDWKSLRGSVSRYVDPTEPVALEDWEAIK